LPRNGNSSIVALCVFGRGVFTGLLPSDALTIHITLGSKEKDYEITLLCFLQTPESQNSGARRDGRC
jgi:hypothetical protein